MQIPSLGQLSLEKTLSLCPRKWCGQQSGAGPLWRSSIFGPSGRSGGRASTMAVFVVSGSAGGMSKNGVYTTAVLGPGCSLLSRACLELKPRRTLDKTLLRKARFIATCTKFAVRARKQSSLPLKTCVQSLSIYNYVQICIYRLHQLEHYSCLCRLLTFLPSIALS